MTRSVPPLRLPQKLAAICALFLALAVPQGFGQHAALVDGVEAIGISVSDMDRAVDFYSKVLTFQKVSDVELAGENYEHLEGVFGLRRRGVRMALAAAY